MGSSRLEEIFGADNVCYLVATTSTDPDRAWAGPFTADELAEIRRGRR